MEKQIDTKSLTKNAAAKIWFGFKINLRQQRQIKPNLVQQKKAIEGAFILSLTGVFQRCKQQDYVQFHL